MAHMKRLLAPSFWNVARKETKWVVTPQAGPHPKFYSIPLSTLLTSMIKLAETTTESKKIIRKGEVFVDGKRRKDYAYAVGLFDVVSIPKTKKNYRVIPNKKGLGLVEIDEGEVKKKIFKIKGKTILKGGKIQLNLHDGKNILVENGNYKIGDSLLAELPELKIVEHLPLQAGSIGIVTRGTASGKLGKVKELLKGRISEQQKVVCEIDKEERTITRNNFVVVGKEKPAIKVN